MDKAASPVLRRLAVISDDGMYRYHLSREWADEPTPMGFIMLNPSTADADVDDPTIRRCMAFARREGCTAINVTNLFAYRATDPRALTINAGRRVGPDNDLWLQRYLDVAVQFGTPLVAAWGAHDVARDRAVGVLLQARRRGVALHCLGQTKTGQPRHPLYVKGDAPLVPWPTRRENTDCSG